MSQKIETKKGGRPKGQPKTGGRKKGTPNYSNVRMRFRFDAQGFDFAAEFIEAFRKIKKPATRLRYLLDIAPFFMQRLREDLETPAAPVSDPNAQEALEAIPTADLLSQLPNRPGGAH